jgi:hypothetical protein
MSDLRSAQAAARLTRHVVHGANAATCPQLIPLLTFGVANNSRAANDQIRPVPDIGRYKSARVGDGVEGKYDFRVGLQRWAQ